MDAVAGLLAGPRAREAFLLRSILEPPWAVQVQDEAPLTLVTVVKKTVQLLSPKMKLHLERLKKKISPLKFQNVFMKC